MMSFKGSAKRLFFRAQMATKRSRSTISCYFPPEIIFEILSYLPHNVLVRIMRVCKAWKSTIRSQKLIKAQQDRSMKTNSRTILILNLHPPDDCQYFSSLVSFDRYKFKAVRVKQPLKQLDELTTTVGYSSGLASIKTTMVGYCDGLVCINYSNLGSKVESFVVRNPLIHKFKKIPPPAEAREPYCRNQNHYCGFGYDSTNDDYKLVSMVVIHELRSEVNIYSLKSKSWKKIQSLPYNKDFRMSSLKLSFLNGALHWVMCHKFDDQLPERVVTLDLATEKYDEIPTPPVDYNSCTKLASLEVLGEYLCVSIYYRLKAGRYESYDVWIMKDYGVAASWTRLYTIEREDMPHRRFGYYCKPLLFSETGEMVLLERNSDLLFWYDLETKKKIRVGIVGVPPSFSTAICVGNLRLIDGDPV